MQNKKSVLLTFIKNPELGKVKTRLASTVGDEKALRIYKRLMAHTRSVASSISAERLLFYSQEINHKDDWSTQYFKKFLQVDGDLGARMTAAFSEGFRHGNKVVIIGSDCPKLSTSIIQQAFDSLDQTDFVIGPALDGGYYLIGMNEFEPAIFNDVEWSTETVKASTLEIIAAKGKSVTELTPLSDVDYEEDWIKYGWEVE